MVFAAMLYIIGFSKISFPQWCKKTIGFMAKGAFAVCFVVVAILIDHVRLLLFRVLRINAVVQKLSDGIGKNKGIMLVKAGVLPFWMTGKVW